MVGTAAQVSAARLNIVVHVNTKAGQDARGVTCNCKCASASQPEGWGLSDRSLLRGQLVDHIRRAGTEHCIGSITVANSICASD